MLHSWSLSSRALGFAALSSLFLSGAASAAEGLSALAGSWSGGGTVRMANGNTEKLRCRATYAVGGGGASANQNLSCASASTNVNIVSNVASNGGTLSGNWTESVRGVSGQVSGRLSGSNISANIAGPGFGAGLSIATSGSSQNIIINVNGGDVQNVSIALKKN